MATASIPVDLYNPGQVFACLGFMEAADILYGDAEGGFDWTDETATQFRLKAQGDGNPFATVLKFLANEEKKITAVAPKGWRPQKAPEEEKELKYCKEFPAPYPDKSTDMPVHISNAEKEVILEHWADGSNRNPFKLYAGNRSALKIATDMLSGTNQTKGINELWLEQQDDLIADPFGVAIPIAGSFNFDPRGGWVSIDTGYSPDKHKHKVTASPVLELLAAWGLQHTRPDEYKKRKVRYSTWGICLPLILARAAFTGGVPSVPMKHFHFELNLSGKNKIVTYSEQEI